MRLRPRARAVGSATGPTGEADGFAAVDAMVALTILSVTIILALAAVQTGRGTAFAAAETRRAAEQLRYLLDTSPRGMKPVTGRSGAFDWRVDTQPAADPHMSVAQICNRTAQLRSLFTGRRYAMASAEICPVS